MSQGFILTLKCFLYSTLLLRIIGLKLDFYFDLEDSFMSYG